MINLKPPTSVWPYGLAVGLVGLAALLTWLFLPLLERTVFLLFFAAMIISFRYGGFGSGVLTAVLSTAVGSYLFLPPAYTWKFDNLEGAVQAGLFLLVALLISWLTETRQQALAALRTSEARFRAIIDNAPALIYLKDLDGRYLLINGHYEQMLGLSRQQIEGKTDCDLFAPETAELFRSNDQRVVEAGQAMQFEEMSPYLAGERTSISIKFPLYDVSGTLYGTCGISTDIHERKRAELAQRLLAEAGKILTGSLDPAIQLSNIAWLAVPNLADWCAVILYDEDWTTHHIAVAHVDPAKVTLAQELQQRYPADQAELTQGLHPWQKGQSQLYTEISDELLKEGARDSEHYQILRRLNMRSAMVTPLVGREQVLGVMVFVWAESGKRYDAQDLALAEELARRATLAIDNARAYEAQQQARQTAEATAEQIGSLQKVTVSLSNALTPGEVINVIMEQAISALKASTSSVLLLNQDGTALELVKAAGYAEEVIEANRRYPLDESPRSSLVKHVVQTGQPLWIESQQEFAARFPELSETQAAITKNEAGAMLPLMVEDRILGLFVLGFMQPRRFRVEDEEFLMTLAGQCAQALERTRLYEAERKARTKAEAAQQHLALLAEMRERNRLAQELHDTVAQALGYLNLKIGLTHSLLGDEKFDAAKANLQELKQVIGETYTDVREEIFYLRSKTLPNLSFMELLNRYIEKYRRFYNLDIQLIQEAGADKFEFPAEVTSQLVRTIQEVLINVRKHAQVNRVIIRLGWENEQLRISVEDEGRGFDPAKIQEKTSNFGLQIMRERVESVGGSLELDTAPGRGTRVVLLYRDQEPDNSSQQVAK